MLPLSRLRSLAELVAPTGQLLGTRLSLGTANANLLCSRIGNVSQPSVYACGAAAKHLGRVANAWETRIDHQLGAQIRAFRSLAHIQSLVGCAGTGWAYVKETWLVKEISSMCLTAPTSCLCHRSQSTSDPGVEPFWCQHTAQVYVNPMECPASVACRHWSCPSQ
jgi:hypothetical protein